MGKKKLIAGIDSLVFVAASGKLYTALAGCVVSVLTINSVSCFNFNIFEEKHVRCLLEGRYAAMKLGCL